MNSTLKTDIAAYHTALTQRNRSHQRQETPTTALAVVGPVAANSTTQVQALSKMIQSDRAAIVAYRKAIPAVLSAVRQRLTVDLKNMKLSLRKSPKA